jgi:hypothetical protein
MCEVYLDLDLEGYILISKNLYRTYGKIIISSLNIYKLVH